MTVLTHWHGEPVQVWARVWKADRVEAHDCLGSTNDRLKELADQGTISPDDLDLFHFVDTAKEGWNMIADHYGLETA